MLNDTSWKDEGLCRRGLIPTSFFYPDNESSPTSVKQIGQAKAVCFGCGVQPVCREYALNNNEQGIWGGTTENERKRTRRRRRGQGWHATPFRVTKPTTRGRPRPTAA